MIERWIDEWFERKQDLVAEIIAAFQNRDREAFEFSLPETVYGFYDLPRNYSGDGTKFSRSDVRLCVAYITGGYSGGSCWEDSNPTRYNESDRPEQGFVTELAAKIIESVPDASISLSTAMSLTRRLDKLTRFYADTVREYYGNSTDYEYQFVLASEFYDLLVELVDGLKE